MIQKPEAIPATYSAIMEGLLDVTGWDQDSQLILLYRFLADLAERDQIAGPSLSMQFSHFLNEKADEEAGLAGEDEDEIPLDEDTDD